MQTIDLQIKDLQKQLVQKQRVGAEEMKKIQDQFQFDVPDIASAENATIVAPTGETWKITKSDDGSHHYRVLCPDGMLYETSHRPSMIFYKLIMYEPLVMHTIKHTDQ
jgi:hypothetical protein